MPIIIRLIIYAIFVAPLSKALQKGYAANKAQREIEEFNSLPKPANAPVNEEGEELFAYNGIYMTGEQRRLLTEYARRDGYTDEQIDAMPKKDTDKLVAYYAKIIKRDTGIDYNLQSILCCPKCNKEISRKHWYCPHCKVRIPFTKGMKIALVFLGFLILIVIMGGVHE